MSWKIVERKVGRAGNAKQRTAKQNEWSNQYGTQWEIGYFLEDAFIDSEEAFDKIYYASYVQHFRKFPDDLQELIQTAKKLRNPHAEATGGVDLQVPAILQYLERHELALQGNELVDIGSWKNTHSHKISIRLSPLHIKLVGQEKITLEKFWQEKKVLVVWEEDE